MISRSCRQYVTDGGRRGMTALMASTAMATPINPHRMLSSQIEPRACAMPRAVLLLRIDREMLIASIFDREMVN